MNLTPDLAKIRSEIEKYARECGLDFFKVIFEVLDWKQMNEVAALGGFPNRYPHWRFGMEYESISKRYSYGLSKIYEMVINNDPCYAYLLYCNHIVDQKLVMAHVYAHCDFFKNNAYFAHTNRKMMDEMANHRSRVMRYINRFGHDIVEEFIDACLSMDSLIDMHAYAIRREREEAEEEEEVAQQDRIPHPKKIRSKPYMDKYINPPDFIESQRERLKKQMEQKKHFPESPVRDTMGFLLEYAPLEAWERDVLSMMREEAYYFAPQGQTKILNEGWGSYWHSKIMTEKALSPGEFIDYADHHSGTLATSPGQLNPYKIGIELFRDIEDRWNKGKFGREYDDCRDMVQKKNWDRKVGRGREKIFEIRKLYNDVMFIDEFMTPEFCQEHKLFVYAYNISSDQFEIADRAFASIKEKFLFQLTNMGRPIIDVFDANYGNRSELLLKHSHEGIDLRIDYAKETLKNIYKIWKRPVNIQTILNGSPKILCYDGENYKEFRP